MKKKNGREEGDSVSRRSEKRVDIGDDRKKGDSRERREVAAKRAERRWKKNSQKGLGSFIRKKIKCLWRSRS